MEEGKFLRHTNCSECGSSDGFALYEKSGGKVDGSCFVCGHYEKNPLSPTEPEEIEIPMSENSNVKGILEYPLRDITPRGISKRVAEKYGVHVGIDTTNGEIDTIYYPVKRKGELTGWKKRDLKATEKGKRFMGIGNLKGSDIFGKDVCGNNGKMLIVTEGEIDALSTYQMFLDRGKHYRVCSLPHGANDKSVKNNLEWFDGFDTIVLAFDQDEVGKKAAKDVAAILPAGKVKVMHFEEKDPNEMLMAGKQPQFIDALYNAETHKVDGIVGVEDIIEEAVKPIEWGLSWPWDGITSITYGIRRKELYGFGGGTGAGKTEGFKELVQHFIHEHNLPVGLIWLEENPAMTLKIIAGKIANKMFHVPDGEWTPEELREGIEHLRDKVFLYNHFGQKDWDTIKAKIRYMVVVLGIKDIFLDHLTALVADEDDVNKALSHIMSEMASLTQELDFTLYYISHLTTPNGTPHEEGGRVTASQFRGSRTIAYWTHFLFGYERDQQAEDKDIRNRVTLRVLKDRYTGLATGETIQLRYNRATGRLEERAGEF